MRILRVFPRRTKATPDDEMAFVGEPLLFQPEADEVRVSCTFTWDKPEAEYLAKAWGNYYATVKLGGPAYEDPGGQFTPGMYLKSGYTVTSRGCPNRCGFCLVPKREGKLRTLKIQPGFNVLDNNLLACPRPHIEAVMAMLAEQPARAQFTGGIEARRVRPWWCKLLADLHPKTVFLAYDRPQDQQHVQIATEMIFAAGITPESHSLACFVLVGYQGDTIAEAQERLGWVQALGVRPYAMYFRPAGEQNLSRPKLWQDFIRQWIRPAAIYAKVKL